MEIAKEDNTWCARSKNCLSRHASDTLLIFQRLLKTIRTEKVTLY